MSFEGSRPRFQAFDPGVPPGIFLLFIGREVTLGAKRVDMHRLQELVRLHRMGTGPREAARMLKMGHLPELAGSSGRSPERAYPSVAVGCYWYSGFIRRPRADE